MDTILQCGSRWRCLAAALVFAVGAGLTAAAPAPQVASTTNLLELSLDDLLAVKVQTVTSAAKYEQRTALAPAAITVVTDRDIQLNGYRNLAEVLGNVRGFYMTYDRNYHYVGVRGFSRPGDYNSRILLLIDGHRVNDVGFDGAPLGNDGYLDVDLIDRIEVVRGPGSAVYGSSAFFGVVNVVTRRGRDLKGVEASVTAGSFDTYQGRFSFGKQFTNGVEWVVSGTVRESGGQRLEFPAGTATNADDESGKSFFTKLGVAGLELTGGFTTRTKQIPTDAYGIDFNTRGSLTRDDRAFADVKYQRQWDEPGVGLLARLYYDYDRYRGYYIYSGARNVDPTEGQRWGAEVQVTKELGERHKLAAGVDFRHTFQIQQDNFNETPFALNLSDSRQNTIISPYLNSEWQLRTNLSFHAGARLDYYDAQTHSANPRLGLVWEPVGGTILKALYGTAFRAPNAYELYYHDGFVTQKPGLSLRPETVDTYEVVWEQAFARHWQFSSSVYYYEIADAITQITDPADGLDVYRNTGRNTGRGAEAELTYQRENGFRASASYTFQETEDGGGAALSNSPKHLLRLRATLPLHGKNVFLSPQLSFTGPTGTNPTSTTPGRVGGYWLFNTTLYSRELIKGISLSVSGYNLLDRRYRNAVGNEITYGQIEQDGRAFQVKLTGKF